MSWWADGCGSSPSCVPWCPATPGGRPGVGSTSKGGPSVSEAWGSARPPSSWEAVDMGAVDGPEIEPTVGRRIDRAGLLYPGLVNGFLGEPEALKSWAVQL